MTTSFLTAILAKHNAEIESEVAQVLADITARLTGSSVAAPAKAHAPSARVGKVAKRGKRSPEELELLTRKLQAYISKNPGQRIEQIGVGMGVSTKELVLPTKKLLGEKKLTTKGQKRATTYSAK